MFRAIGYDTKRYKLLIHQGVGQQSRSHYHEANSFHARGVVSSSSNCFSEIKETMRCVLSGLCGVSLRQILVIGPYGVSLRPVLATCVSFVATDIFCLSTATWNGLHRRRFRLSLAENPAQRFNQKTWCEVETVRCIAYPDDSDIQQ